MQKFQDYAIETPMLKSLSSAEVDALHEVKIDIKPNTDISAINFVLKVCIFLLAVGDVSS